MKGGGGGGGGGWVNLPPPQKNLFSKCPALIEFKNNTVYLYDCICSFNLMLFGGGRAWPFTFMHFMADSWYNDS